MNIRNGKFLLKHIFIAILMVCFALDTANGASTRSTNRVAAKRSASATPTTTTTTITQTTTTEESAPVVEETPEISVINKASVFDSAINANVGFGDSVSSNDSGLAEQIRKQRAALEARDNLNVVALNQQAGMGGKNACDGALRQCMQKTCGNDFTKCAMDGDTAFGDKLNKCKRDTTCTGEEFKLFTIEIKADRDLNAKLSSYQSVLDCGNNYNSCIQTECGATFGKCLGKTAADQAINKCATIAKNCMEQDSGLSARVGTVIARLREDAEKDVKTDEERMYKLRDLMKSQCEKFGAMFDERSFDCVYTVNFFAGSNQTTPMASRKRYAGDTFVCTQEWFGTNVTTYKENAYRETRAQTAASSAMLGSGVGTAVGLVTSDAIGRALDTQKSKKDLKNECKEQGKTFKNGECVDDAGDEEETEQAETIDSTGNDAKGVPATDKKTNENAKKIKEANDNLIDAQKKTEEAKKKYEANKDDNTAQDEYVAARKNEYKAMSESAKAVSDDAKERSQQHIKSELGPKLPDRIEPRNPVVVVGSTGGDSGGGKGGNTSGDNKGDGDGALKRAANKVGDAAKKTGQAVGNAAKTVANAFRKKDNRK